MKRLTNKLKVAISYLVLAIMYVRYKDSILKHLQSSIVPDHTQSRLGLTEYCQFDLWCHHFWSRRKRGGTGEERGKQFTVSSADFRRSLSAAASWCKEDANNQLATRDAASLTSTVRRRDLNTKRS